eukprot:UN04489
MIIIGIWITFCQSFCIQRLFISGRFGNLVHRCFHRAQRQRITTYGQLKCFTSVLTIGKYNFVFLTSGLHCFSLSFFIFIPGFSKERSIKLSCCWSFFVFYVGGFRLLFWVNYRCCILFTFSLFTLV